MILVRKLVVQALLHNIYIRTEPGFKNTVDDYLSRSKVQEARSIQPQLDLRCVNRNLPSSLLQQYLKLTACQ